MRPVTRNDIVPFVATALLLALVAIPRPTRAQIVGET
jgi:pyruvate kinase